MLDREIPDGPAPAAKAGPAPVAFDFDGTLTTSDTFTAFILWRTSGWVLVAGGIRLIPAFLAYMGRRDRGRMKAAVVRVFLRGVSRAALEAQAQAFADSAADRLFRPDALQAFAHHQSRGERLMIVTASPDVLIQPFARRLGAQDLIGTRLAYDDGDRIKGGLESKNCRGPEKVRRLAALGVTRLSAAYGDTSGDLQMLSIADRPFMKTFKARPPRPVSPSAASRFRPM